MWLLPIALQIINSIQINDVLQGWIEVLCVLVPKLPLKVISSNFGVKVRIELFFQAMLHIARCIIIIGVMI